MKPIKKIIILILLSQSCGDNTKNDNTYMLQSSEPVNDNGALLTVEDNRRFKWLMNIDTFKRYHEFGFAFANATWWENLGPRPASPTACLVFGPYIEIPGPGNIVVDFTITASVPWRHYNFKNDQCIIDPNRNMFTIDISSNKGVLESRTYKFSDFKRYNFTHYIDNREYVPIEGIYAPDEAHPYWGFRVVHLPFTTTEPISRFEARICSLDSEVQMQVASILIKYEASM